MTNTEKNNSRHWREYITLTSWFGNDTYGALYYIMSTTQLTKRALISHTHPRFYSSVSSMDLKYTTFCPTYSRRRLNFDLIWFDDGNVSEINNRSCIGTVYSLKISTFLFLFYFNFWGAGEQLPFAKKRRKKTESC